MSTFVKFYVPVYLVIYFATAIFLKTYIQYKKTGVNPFTFGRKPESAHDYIGFWFRIVLGSIIAHGFLYSFGMVEKIEFLDSYPLQVAGITLTIISLGFTFYAQNAMGNSWRIGIDEEVGTGLVTSGPFAYTRNPIFLAMLITLLGLFMITPTYVLGFLLILSHILINTQVRLEEEFLAKIHGKAYLEYKGKVNRFIPKLG